MNNTEKFVEIVSNIELWNEDNFKYLEKYLVWRDKNSALLISLGRDPSIVEGLDAATIMGLDDNGNNILHHAVKFGCVNLIKYILRIDGGLTISAAMAALSCQEYDSFTTIVERADFRWEDNEDLFRSDVWNQNQDFFDFVVLKNVHKIFAIFIKV